MGLFRKESGDIVDFTILQKRGIIKKVEPKENQIKIDNKTGFIDLTPPAPSILPSPVSIDSSPSDIFGFLDSKTQEPSSVSNLTDPPQNKEVEHLKVKIDDLEYKIERLLEKISLLENKMVDN